MRCVQVSSLPFTNKPATHFFTPSHTAVVPVWPCQRMWEFVHMLWFVDVWQRFKNKRIKKTSKLHSFFVLWYISHWIFISYLDSVHTGRLCPKPIGSIDHFEMQKLFRRHAFPYTFTYTFAHHMVTMFPRCLGQQTSSTISVSLLHF